MSHFYLKITVFTAVKYCSILHGHVCVMVLKWLNSAHPRMLYWFWKLFFFNLEMGSNTWFYCFIQSGHRFRSFRKRNRSMQHVRRLFPEDIGICFPIKLWNHYEHDGPRSNNALEGWHGRLNRLAMKPRTNLLEAIEKV